MAACNMTLLQVCAGWILTLMTCVLPPERVGDHFLKVFEDGWLTVYKEILIILEIKQGDLILCNEIVSFQAVL